MRLFLIISITLISLSSNSQNCKKLLLTHPKEKVVVYLFNNKNIYTAKFKMFNSEEVQKVEKIEKYKNNIFFLIHDNTHMYIDLDKKKCVDLNDVIKYDITISQCEF